MTVERRGDLDGDSRVRRERLFDQFWKIALQMRAMRQKIGNHDDMFEAAPHKHRDGPREIRLAAFEKRDLDSGIATPPAEFVRDRAHRVVGGGDARSVREDDVSGIGPRRDAHRITDG